MRATQRAVLTLSAIVARSCADATSISDDASPWDLGDLAPALDVVPTLTAVCGDVTSGSVTTEGATVNGSLTWLL